MAEKDVRLYEPVPVATAPNSDGTMLLHAAEDGGPPPPGAERLVECKCGSLHWLVELVGEKFTDDDGYPAQHARYTCAECGGGLRETALP